MVNTYWSKLLKNVLEHSAFAFMLFCIEWWLADYSGLNLPNVIPYTPINIRGVFLVTVIIFTLILFNKQLKRKLPGQSLLDLTLFGVVVIFLSELLFQSLKIIIVGNTKDNVINTLATPVIGMSVFAIPFSFLIAFQLKTGKTKLLIIFIVLWIIIFNLVMYAYNYSKEAFV